MSEEKLRKACEAALEFFDHADFDMSNGNTDSTGTIDEGQVRGAQWVKEVRYKLLDALGKSGYEVCSKHHRTQLKCSCGEYVTFTYDKNIEHCKKCGARYEFLFNILKSDF